MSILPPSAINRSLDLTSAFPEIDQVCAQEAAITVMSFILYLTMKSADWETEIHFQDFSVWLNIAEFSEFYQNLPHMRAFGAHNAGAAGTRELVRFKYLKRRDPRDDEGNIYFTILPKLYELVSLLSRKS